MAAGGERQCLTLILANLAFSMEKADEMILPAAYKFMGASLAASPAELGGVLLCRALAQAAASPLAGLLGDRLHRGRAIGVACLLYGAMTVALGAARTLRQAFAAAAALGVGLAVVVPCVQSLVADAVPTAGRGRAFGCLFFTSALGGMVGGFYTTTVGGMRVAGVEGWRAAFFVVSALSVATGLLMLAFADDPRSSKKWGPGLAGWHRALAAQGREWGHDVGLVLRIRSFQLIVAQGIVGTMPWIAMGFLTLYLQLLGFSDGAAAALVAVLRCGFSVGGWLGGLVGDALTARWGPCGRLAASQASIALGFPFALCLLRGLPPPPPGAGAGLAVWLYASVLLVGGMLISWPGTNNSTVFADIVPEQLRSAVFAFDRSFEGAVGAMAAPLVGLVAERAFGFAGPLGGKDVAAPEVQAANARALGSAMLVLMLAPWGAAFVLFTGLYYVLPADCEASQQLGRLLSKRSVEEGLGPKGHEAMKRPVSEEVRTALRQRAT